MHTQGVPTDAPVLWTPEDVARITGLSVVTLARYRMLRTGPPFHRLGRAIRYAKEDVAEWLRSHAVRTGGAR